RRHNKQVARMSAGYLHRINSLTGAYRFRRRNLRSSAAGEEAAAGQGEHAQRRGLRHVEALQLVAQGDRIGRHVVVDPQVGDLAGEDVQVAVLRGDVGPEGELAEVVVVARGG